MRGKTVALLVLLIVMAGTFYAATAPIEVSSNESMSLFDILYSLGRTSVALCDPVPGSGPGGDN